MEMQGTRRAKTTLKKNQVEGLTVPDLSTYYKAAVMKTVYTINIPEK